MDYLQELYETAAEPMPNMQGRSEVAAARTALQKFEDRRPEGRALLFRRIRGRRPAVLGRQRKKRTESAGENMRCLPPGTFKDYLNLLQAKIRAGYPGHEHVKPDISLKLFNKAAPLSDA